MMKLLRDTRELEIITENAHETKPGYKELGGIHYPLYEGNYISGIRMIFQQVVDIEIKKAEEKSNILSFIGERGTGKTTAMKEFCSILSGMNNQKRIRWWLQHTLEESEQQVLCNKDFCFHVLDSIDASLLAEKEDLFELILANLYKKFEEKMRYKTYGYKDEPAVRNVLNDFSEIAKLYSNVIAHETESGENTFLSRLQLMKGSQQIKEKIAELVESLFSIERVADYEYIVVAIDDLDLNLRHGYEMLEQLQKYFSYHKIIVLVTVDYKQMQLICEEFFKKSMFHTSKLYSGREQGRALANDYLMKVFPLSQRMYMPELRRISKKSKIKLDNKVFEVASNGHIDKSIVVKQFVLSKIAEAMEIYYDACGLKMHFSEPETVRNLVSYNEFLESLEEIDYKNLKVHEELITKEEAEYNVEVLKKYDQNHERFNMDIGVRMAQSILNYEQKEAFNTLKKRDLERRARYFVCAKRVEKKILFGNIIRDNPEYAYGDLLEKIYTWGEKDVDGDYFLDKPFICCVLAMFTSEMICEYIKYRHNPDEDKRDKYKTRLRGFLGKSFSNSWLGEVFPKVTDSDTFNDVLNNEKEKEEVEEKEKGQYYLYRDGIPQEEINFKISLEALKIIMEENNQELKNIKIRNAVETWLKNTQIIEILECVDMFFIRQEGTFFKGITYEFKLASSQLSGEETKNVLERVNAGKTKGNINILEVTGKGEKVKLDIMGFVAKSMNYQEVAQALYMNIVDGLTKFLCEYLSIESEEIKKVIEDRIKSQYLEKSLFKDYMNKDGIDKNKFKEDIAFPFYNLDMSYYIFKRVKGEYKNTTIKEDDVFEKLIEFYGYIEGALQKQEKEYKLVDNFKYTKTFQECPYIKAFKNWNQKGSNQKESNVPKVLQTVFHNILSKLEIKGQEVSEAKSE